MSEPRNPFPRLPHAAPFLLLDRVLDVDDKAGTFLKLVSAADPCIAPDGHLPAAFVLEALAQAGGALLTGQSGGPTAGYLVAVDEFRTHGEVRVGDALHLEVAIVRTFGVTVVFRGRALVGDEVRAEARFTLSPPR
jgi:3-hydroxymyristoyl/3-hydroxydecanoyl-(acyl carrier protein) dehydratase